MATVIKDMEHPERYAKVTTDGKLETTASISTGDIEIGAVEIKNHDTDDRAYVDSSHRLHVYDEAGGGALPADIITGSVTPGTSAGQITSTSTALVARITFRADSSNEGKIYIGNSSNQNQVLEAGEFIDVFVDDLSKVYLKSDNGTEVVTYSTG